MLRDRLPWIGVVGVAVALRLYGLTTQSLWHDELFTRYAATQSSLWAAIDVGAVQDVHPPGFVAAMYAWVRLAGDSEAALRLPSVLAGVLAVAGSSRRC
jgi:predicted membrane-bound mannosyltransferase